MEYNYHLIGYVLSTPNVPHIQITHHSRHCNFISRTMTVYQVPLAFQSGGMCHITAWQMRPRLEPVSLGSKTHVLFFSSEGDHKWRSHLSSRSVVNSPLLPLSLFSRLSPGAGKSSLNCTNALVMPLSLPRRATNPIWMSGTTPKVTPLMLVMDHRVFRLMRLDLPHLPCWGYTDGSEAG